MSSGSALNPATSTESIELTGALAADVGAARLRLVELWDAEGEVSERCWGLEEPLSIGRSGDVALNDRSASREHAHLRPSRVPGRVLLVDNGSHNGTWVNGERCERAVLARGDVVRVGRTLLAIDAVGPAGLGLAEELAARSAAMLEVMEGLEALVRTDVRVLLRGEPGVGKQVLAEAVHRLSGVEGAFIEVNCARLDREMIDSELFGHLRGAFTNAVRDRRGLIAQADGGTLFLDEVGELPMDSQARLLRVLEDGVVRPLGADRGAEVEFRLVAATNADLEAAVAAGRFRQDLLHRLSEWPVNVPPLRDRLPDVPAVLAKLGHPIIERLVVREALALSLWPDNVRGLTYASRRLRLAEQVSDPLRLMFPSGPPRQRGPAWTPAASPPESAEDLRLLLAAFEGNVSAAARHIDRSREILYRLMRRFEVQ